MADYTSEMKALEGLMAQEEKNKAEARDTQATGNILANIGTTVFGGDPKAMQQAWTGRATNRLNDSTERRKALMDKYKMNAGLQGKIMDRSNKMEDARTLAEEKFKRDKELFKLKEGSQAKKIRPLTAGSVTKITDTEDAMASLEKLYTKIKGKADLIGPIKGFARFNPWDTDIQSLQSDINLVKQVVGKALEGGVLRKEDEEKYKKILANVSDQPTVAYHKISQIIEDIKGKRTRLLENYKKAGFDISQYGELPSSLAVSDYNKTKGKPPMPGTNIAGAIENGANAVGDAIIPSAEASTLTPEDKQAIQWAKQNMGDPRAAKILQIHGVQ